MDAGPPPDAGPLPIPDLHLTALFDAGEAEAGQAVLPPDAGLDGGADAGAPGAGSPPPNLSLPDASIPDVATLVFQSSAALEDARFRLFTEGDRLVPNHAEISVSDGGTLVVLTPAPYWPAQGCCRFSVDGETEAFPTGGGHRYQKFEAYFGVVAEPHRLQAAIVKKQKQKRRRHHR